ncbi:hypothetical protein [Paraburkholderia sp. SIMBA_054]|uniref:hypothetical protein n=1 Tax=Paraburkholderia sp. SIMBA_054 TaxID=3085795 RepID=UPI00397A91AF
MTEQQIDAYCDRWLWWSQSRRLYVPAGKLNILARLQPRRSAVRETDARLDPEMPYFNSALHGLFDEQGCEEEAACFLGVYWYDAKIKQVAAELKCARGTVYNRARKFAQDAIRMSKALKKAHESMSAECSRNVEQNSSCVD